MRTPSSCQGSHEVRGFLGGGVRERHPVYRRDWLGRCGGRLGLRLGKELAEAVLAEAQRLLLGGWLLVPV